MDYLKRVVPPIFSGDVALDFSESFQESSPRLVKMRRLSLLSSEKTTDEEDGVDLCHCDHGTCQHQLGKVKPYYF